MSDDHSARLALPYLAAGQMQKHVTLNEALTRLDALVQTAVASRTDAAPPAGPADGTLHILPEGATGAWAGFPAGTLVRAETGAWQATPAPDGLIALVKDAQEFVVRDGGVWVPLGARLEELRDVARFGLGTVADAGNPFAARLNKALWTALEAGAGGDGDLRVTLNKEGPADVLSLLFQSGWGGRAELGLIGDDDLRLKVSPDGGTWRDVFSVDRISGRATFPLGAMRRATTVFNVGGTYPVPAWARLIEAVVVGGGGGGGAGAHGASGARCGGGGGGAGGVHHAAWPADQLGESLTVIVGAGGAGGIAASGEEGAGSAIRLGSIPILATTGGGGGESGATGGTGGVSGAPASNGGGGSDVSAAGGAGWSFDRPDAPGGGGAGGGLDAAGVAYGGGPGGDGGVLAVKGPGGPGGNAAPGSAGADAPHPALHWAGGGAGGGGAAASGAGHPGAAGGVSGGGGGGGGAGAAAGGSGGAGATGTVRLTAIG